MQETLGTHPALLPIYLQGGEGVSKARIIEWFGLEGTFKTMQYLSPAIGRDTSLQSRLLTAPSSLALNISREGASTASLGNMFLIKIISALLG